jgi:signal transduction histidine kinase/ActR/RegA family two-component response regulator
LVRRALASAGMVSTLIHGEQTSNLVVALGRPDGLVVFEQSVFSNDPLPVATEGPFHDLDAALYRTPTDDPANILVTTTGRPMTGAIDSRLLAFGAEQWLLQVKAKVPLAGDQAQSVPWVILFAGLASALLAGGVVAVTVRRRAYALSLVDQRTADLRETMTDLEVARAAADSANKAKSQFLSGMSHELRTPLNAVLGFAQLIELNESLPDADRDAVAHIIRGGSHLLTLINEVLDISRVESGEMAMSPESVLVANVIDEVIDLMRPLAAARSINLIDGPSTCVHYVFADKQRLKQILLNLVSNAVKYNRVGGSVSVSCEEVTATRLRIKVIDSGHGISKEDIGLLFEPFERLGATLSDIEGSGIGLTLSRRLAEAMQGTLDVESAVGNGSTFWVELPLVEGTVERYERLPHNVQPVPASPGGNRRILCIEDNLANITLIKRILGQLTDIELISAMQGRIGLDLARDHQPDLILMDLHLPDMTGEEVLGTLRTNPATRSIPVIVVSADATAHQIQRLKAAGASAYITKPFNVRELISTITEQLDQHG